VIEGVEHGELSWERAAPTTLRNSHAVPRDSIAAMAGFDTPRASRGGTDSGPLSLHVVAAIRSIALLTYVETVLESVLERGHRLTLLFDKRWSKDTSPDLLNAFVERWPDVQVDWLRRRKGGTRDPLLASRELRSYGAFVRRLGRDSRYTVRWGRYLPEWAQRACRDESGFKGKAFHRVLESGLSDRGLALAESLAPAYPEIVAHLRSLSPDVVLVTPANFRFDKEIDYVKAAHRVGVPSAILVLSWDNLTTKGLFHVEPSLFLAWNEAHAADATTFHGIPRTRIRIVGSPFFDKWLDGAFEPLAREEFLPRVGLDPDKPYILYLGSSKHIAPDEGWVVDSFAEALDRNVHPMLRSASLLVRPHPFNRSAHADLRSERVLVWPDEVRLPEFGSDQRDLVSALAHAVCAVGLNTSALIDAVALDAPTLTVVLEHYAQTQAGTEHFRHLVDSGAMEVATSFDDLASRVAATAAGSDPTASARARFVEAFLRPGARARSAGDVAAEVLQSLALARR
jgi:hypothetical protein